MAQFPALPFFTDAWVADTKHLTYRERGIYIDLLVLIWRNPGCRIPNDDAWLAKRLGMSGTEVAAELRPLIKEFCKSTGNWVTQRRLLKEWEWCKLKSEKQSASAKSRWAKENTSQDRNARTSDVAYARTESLAMPSTLPFLKERKLKADSANAATQPTLKNNSSKPNSSKPEPPQKNGPLPPAQNFPPPATDEKSEFYARARSVLGATAGGLAKKLLDAKNGSVPLARAALETASTKGGAAREYIGGVIRKSTTPSTIQAYDPRL